MRRHLTPLLVLAALAAPAAARADTFCVNAPGCPAGGVSTGGDLQAALDDASSRGGDNTVLVGDPGAPYRGPFTYRTGRVLGGTLRIAATPGAHPVLTAGAGDTVLTLEHATLDGIDVTLPTASEGTGIALEDGTLHAVTVASSGGGPGAVGVAVLGQSQLDHVRIDMPADVGLGIGQPAPALFSTSVTAQNLEISGPLVGLDVNSAGRLSLVQSQLTAVSDGLRARGPASLDRVTVATSDPTSTGITADATSVGLEHVTVAHTGPGAGSDVALSVRATSADAVLSVLDSAFAGYTHGIVRDAAGGHTAALTATRSVWSAAGDQLGGAASGPVRDIGNVNASPVLVNLAGGDLRPRGSSPQIDLDTTSDPRTYADMVDTPAVDGNGDGAVRADAGALEYRRRPPRIEAMAAPASGTVGASLSFAATADDLDGDAVQVRWQFGDGTSAAGSTVSHVFTTPGTAHATVIATDEAGLTDTRAFTVNVAAAAAHPTVPQTRLVLSRVRLSDHRISRRRARSLRLRFTVNEPATLSISVRRRHGRRTITAPTIVRHVRGGSGSITLGSALRRPGLVAPGRVSLTVSASDASGHRIRPRVLTFVVVR